MSSLGGWNKPPVSGVWDLGSSCPFRTFTGMGQEWAGAWHSRGELATTRSLGSGPAERHLPPRSPAQALPGPEVPGARGPRAPQSHLVVAHCSASLGAPTARRAGSSPPPRPSPAQHPRQARALISATGPRKVAGAGGTGDADAGQQVARVARTAAQREVCACALLRRGVGGPDRGRGSASGSRPLGPPRVGVA